MEIRKLMRVKSKIFWPVSYLCSLVSGTLLNEQNLHCYKIKTVRMLKKIFRRTTQMKSLSLPSVLQVQNTSLSVSHVVGHFTACSHVAGHVTLCFTLQDTSLFVSHFVGHFTICFSVSHFAIYFIAGVLCARHFTVCVTCYINFTFSISCCKKFYCVSLQN
jgi:hypothetical protein